MRPTRLALPSLTSMTSGLSPRVSSSLDLLLLFPDAQFVAAPRIRCPLVDSPPTDAAFPGKAADDTRHSLWPRSQPRRKPRGQRGWTDRPTHFQGQGEGGTNPVFRSVSTLVSLPSSSSADSIANRWTGEKVALAMRSHNNIIPVFSYFLCTLQVYFVVRNPLSKALYE